MMGFTGDFIAALLARLSRSKLARPGNNVCRRFAEWVGHTEIGREGPGAGNGWDVLLRGRSVASIENGRQVGPSARETESSCLGEAASRPSDRRGRVCLVGAGPGDPGLLTLKGKECLEEADVVIYDYLVNGCLLAHSRSEAERIHVGKPGAEQRLSQQEINSLMIGRAREGKVVVRLKGGDPFIFSRGAEEVEALVDAGVSFEVVPGITSAIAVPSYAGIPLTHRHLASSVAFVTGHEDPTKETSGIDWKAVAGLETVVILMGASRLPQLVSRLLEEGREPETPVAVIQWGTLARQKTVTGTLEDIREKAREIRSPAVIVVGEVVRLRDRLQWFEEVPLSSFHAVARQQHAIPVKLSDA